MLTFNFCRTRKLFLLVLANYETCSNVQKEEEKKKYMKKAEAERFKDMSVDGFVDLWIHKMTDNNGEFKLDKIWLLR